MDEMVKPNPDMNQFVLVCGHCAGHSNKGNLLEINWIDMKMYYKCPDCKKMNVLDFSLLKPEPYPRTIFRR